MWVAICFSFWVVLLDGVSCCEMAFWVLNTLLSLLICYNWHKWIMADMLSRAWGQLKNQLGMGSTVKQQHILFFNFYPWFTASLSAILCYFGMGLWQVKKPGPGYIRKKLLHCDNFYTCLYWSGEPVWVPVLWTSQHKWSIEEEMFTMLLVIRKCSTGELLRLIGVQIMDFKAINSWECNDVLVWVNLFSNCKNFCLL